MYRKILPLQEQRLAHVKKGVMCDIYKENDDNGRLILRGGRITDPGNQMDGEGDLVIQNGEIFQEGGSAIAEKGDRIIDYTRSRVCRGLSICISTLEICLK